MSTACSATPAALSGAIARSRSSSFPRPERAARRRAPASGTTRRPPDRIPPGCGAGRRSSSGTIAGRSERPCGQRSCIARAAVARHAGRQAVVGFVIVDIPIDDQMLDSLHESTGVKAGSTRLGGDAAAALPSVTGIADGTGGSDRFTLFERSVTMLDATQLGDRRGAPRHVLEHLLAARALREARPTPSRRQVGRMSPGQAFLLSSWSIVACCS